MLRRPPAQIAKRLPTTAVALHLRALRHLASAAQHGA